ncbi:glucosaminidase domain-containing protein [Neolewinella sp.]|uniref:glucosaminidase domain-containing protein n=1 Tax=Neolewinella sp. TaxID=2993543 RepID=UPI003B51BDE1
MKGLLTATFLVLSLFALAEPVGFGWTAEENSEQEAYIERYKTIAMQEMERAGIPASIKLAQGILESNSGQSYLARTAKNHFGIKCGTNWNGDKVYREDDDYDDRGRLTKSCFRQYRNADASYVAHSEFLRDPRKSFRYGFLFRLEPTDYKAWARGLRKSGYATNPRYPELLITLIERHKLYQYDVPGATTPVNIEVPVEEAITGILQQNDVSYFISEAPLTVQQIAQQVDLSVRRLLDYNEALVSGSQLVDGRERIYLQKKRRSYRGGERYHTVAAGETLYDIAQRYGLRLRNLARRNRLGEQADPATGEQIKLRGSRIRTAPRLESTATVRPPTIEVAPAAPVDRPTTATPPAGEDDGGFLDMGAPISPNTPVPEPAPRPVPAPGAGYHAVQSGDTLYGISRKYGVSVDELKRLNALTGNTISVGQQLRIR